MKANTLKSRHFTGDAQNAQTVGAVGRQTDVQNRIGQVERLFDGEARAQAVVERHQPRAVFTQSQFGGAAQHALRLLTADHAFGDRYPAGQLTAGQGQRRHHCRRGIGGPANHLAGAAPALNQTQFELVRIRMGGYGRDTADDRLFEVIVAVFNGFNLQTQHGESIGQLVGSQLNGNIFV